MSLSLCNACHKKDQRIEELKAENAELTTNINVSQKSIRAMSEAKTEDAYRIAEFEAQLAHQNCTTIRVCHWSEDEEGHWFGKCGIGWTFNDLPSTPKEHDMNYCPKCAGVIIPKQWSEDKAEGK